LLTIVGLGNPGASYKNSRHNVGFVLVDSIAEGTFLSDATFKPGSYRVLRRILGRKRVFEATAGPYVRVEGKLGGKRFLLVKPTTFMNESGRALSYLTHRGIVKDLSEVLIVVDDVDLDIGRIRLRARGSAGGHNGLKSIIKNLGTEEFARLKIGIGPRPDGADLVEYVLGKFQPEEREIIDRSLGLASTVVEAWITGGFEKARKMISQNNTSKI
jgi:PTH1 family peptidyl-tRNA hydrolase